MSQPDTFISQVTARANTILGLICNFAEGNITVMSLLYFFCNGHRVFSSLLPHLKKKTNTTKPTKNPHTNQKAEPRSLGRTTKRKFFIKNIGCLNIPD